MVHCGQGGGGGLPRPGPRHKPGTVGRRKRFPFARAELLSIAAENGFDGPALLAAADWPQTARRYESQTDRAIARGVFGMPFYIFRDEPFWGQDRLEMLEAALAS